MCTLLFLSLLLSPVVVLSPGDGGNRGKNVQRMEVAEEGDSEEEGSGLHVTAPFLLSAYLQPKCRTKGSQG